MLFVKPVPFEGQFPKIVDGKTSQKLKAVKTR